MTPPLPDFVKAPIPLMELGLPKTLLLLYARLRLHAGKDGKCYPTHATLAKELGLKHPRSITRLLRRLCELGLVEWKRGRYRNSYTVRNPDFTELQTQTSPNGDIRLHQTVIQKRSLPKEALKRKKASLPASLPRRPDGWPNWKRRSRKHGRGYPVVRESRC